MTTNTEELSGMAHFAHQVCGTTPAGKWFDPNNETVILGRVPKDDDDPLLSDLSFQHYAKVRKAGSYPDLERVSVPCSYATISSPLPYPPTLVARLGQAGYDPTNGVVNYACIEFDLKADGKHEGTGVTAAEIEQIESALAEIGCCELARSTGGGGLHVRVPMRTPVSVANRKQYGDVNRHVLQLLDQKHNLPLKLADKVDATALGRGVLWLWSCEMNERSFQLISAASEKLDLADWRPPTAAERAESGDHGAVNGFDWQSFLERNNIPFTTKEFAQADNGEGYLITCPKGHGDTSDSKTMVWSQHGRPYGKCMADKCKKLTGKDFLKLLAPCDSASARTPAEWMVSELLYLTREDEFFHDANGNPFVQYRYKGSAPETFAVGSQKYRDCLRLRYSTSAGSPIPENPLSLVVSQLEAKARLDSAAHPVFVRVAASQGKHYLDLCDDDRQCIEIDAAGWRVAPAPTGVRFTRPPNLRPLPIPERGGSIDLLRKYVRVNASDWCLIPGWLLGAMRSDAPCPGLALFGPGGSFKSNTVEMVISLFHPTAAESPKEFTVTGYPKSVDDLIVSAYNSWVVTLDNVSEINQALSDAICSVITGSRRMTRTLYKDQDITILNVRRPVAITSTKQCITATDLADRFIIIDVARQDDVRRPEQELWDEFREDRPKILGALLDAYSLGLANLATTVVNDSPRMMDFAKFVTAAESSFGFIPGTTVSAMNDRQRGVAEDAVGESPLAQALLQVAHEGGFEGIAKKLIERIGDNDNWSSTPRKFVNQLNAVIPDLQKVGLAITSKPGRSKSIVWVIPPVTVEQPIDDGMVTPACSGGLVVDHHTRPDEAELTAKA